MTEIIGIDHIYITVSDMARSEAFYDCAMKIMGFRKSTFAIEGYAHIHYFNRHFGYVLRPARSVKAHDAYSPGLHHLCFRVDSVADVILVTNGLRATGINAIEPKLHSEYAPDYWATFFSDPDGIRLEVTNYRQERQERHAQWDQTQD